MTCDAYTHLTRVAVEIRDVDLLPVVAEQLAWRYLPETSVANCHGPGLLPPDWRYPLVVQDGQVAFADFGNAWGNAAGVEQFKGRYTLERAKRAAAEQGFDFDEADGELVIYQPSGVTVTVRQDGTLEINRLDLTDGDPTVYLQEALGTVVENAYEAHAQLHAEAAWQVEQS